MDMTNTPTTRESEENLNWLVNDPSEVDSSYADINYEKFLLRQGIPAPARHSMPLI